jgi:drug/metabolite transporter (DMT)-like permease
MRLASILTMIGALASVLYAMEKIPAAISQLIRSCVPVVAALRELLEALKHLRGIGQK